MVISEHGSPCFDTDINLYAVPAAVHPLKATTDS